MYVSFPYPSDAREKAEELEYEDFAANPDAGTESTKEYKITAVTQFPSSLL